jgi:hypothetical protein
MKNDKTCARCGRSDASVLDLDTGSAFHPEPADCLRAELAEVKAKLAAAEAFVAKAAKTADGVPIHDAMELFAADGRKTQHPIIAEMRCHGVTDVGPYRGCSWDDRADRYYSTPEAAKVARAAEGAK